MTEDDRVLVQVLAAQDALRLPVRDWSGHASSNRYQMSRAGGVPFRSGRTADADRKSAERVLSGLAEAGLLAVGRGSRVRFPLVSLTPAGDARARALAGLPDRKVGFLFTECVARLGLGYVETVGGRWVPEVDLNNGRGWGLDATPEDRRGLSATELDFLAAAAQGWATTGSTARGHVGYAATEAGLAEVAKPTRSRVGKLPAFDEAAAGLYRREQDARLSALHRDRPADPREIGPLPFAEGMAFMRAGDEDDDPDQDRLTDDGCPHPADTNP